jgi:hypothetical protein
MPVKNILLTILLCLISFPANAYEQTTHVFSNAGGEQKGGQFTHMAVIGESIVIQTSKGANDAIAFDNSAGFLFVSGSSPLPPTGLSLDQADDSGIYHNDQITNITNALTLSGFGKDNAEIFLYEQNELLGSGFVQNDHFSIDINLSGEGSHIITARQMIDGNISEPSQSIEIYIDTINPDSPVLLYLEPEDDSGDKDHVTNHKTELTLTGKGEANTQLILTDNDIALNYQEWLENNTFSIDISLHDDGVHGIQGQLTDLAGNESVLSAPLTITIDTQKPVISIINPENGRSYNRLFEIKGNAIDMETSVDNIELQVYCQWGENKYYINESLDKWVYDESWIVMDNPDNWTMNAMNINWWPDLWYTIVVKAHDSAGNMNAEMINFGINIEYDTEISASFSKSDIILGEPILISGTLNTDYPDPTSDKSTIYVSIPYPENNELIIGTIDTQIPGDFDTTISCNAFPGAGSWPVTLRWDGIKGKYKGNSFVQSIDVKKVQTELILKQSYQKLKLNDTISLTGHVKNTNTCNTLFHKIPVTLTFTGPHSTAISLTTSTRDDGVFNVTDFDRFNQIGQWTIVATFRGDDNYDASTSEPVSIDVIETAGYAIIIQGRNSVAEGLVEHHKTVGFVKDALMNRNFLAEDIKVFGYSDDKEAPIDFEPDSIKAYMLSDLKDKMIDLPANLYIVMVDHGGPETFFADPYEITAAHLDGWLDDLKEELTKESSYQAANQEMVIIIGACHSGSFIPKLSAKNRIIITSAAENQNSFKGKAGADGILEGDFFIHALFDSLSTGKTIKQSFKDASILTYDFAYVNAVNSAIQTPLIDDNADCEGTRLDEYAYHMDSDMISLSGSDALLLADISIGSDPVSVNSDEKLKMIQFTETILLNHRTQNAILWAKVNDQEKVLDIWVEIKTPAYTPYNENDPTIINPPDRFDDITVYNEMNQRYEWELNQYFTEPGTYQILYYAIDQNTGTITSTGKSWLYKNCSENHPPTAVNLIAPADAALVTPAYFQNQYYMILDWDDVSDENAITYTVELSKDNGSFDNPVQIERLISSTFFLQVDHHIDFNHTYYWKVLAIDEFGSQSESQVRSFKTRSPNPNDRTGLMNGCVYHVNSKQVIAHAKISSNINIGTTGGGCFFGIGPATEHIIFGEAQHYHDNNIAYTIKPAKQTRVDLELWPLADINNNGKIELGDILIALQVLCGFDIAIDLQADINQDKHIDWIETLYLMERLARQN